MYRLLWVVCRISLRFFFRKIEVTGLDNVPTSGPVILAANHQNTFLDAVVVACSLKRPIFSLTRGDVFKLKWIRYLLRQLHMMPIYRFRDGHGQIRKNLEAFDAAHDILKKDKALLIFPEGNHAQEYRLRPLQKGVARIAQRYVEIEKKSLTVVPIGLNYSNHRHSGGTLLIRIGQPILFSEDQHSETQRSQLTVFTQDVQVGLTQQVIHIEGDYTLVYKRWQGSRKFGKTLSETFHHDKLLIKQIEAGSERIDAERLTDNKRRFSVFSLWYSINHWVAKRILHYVVNGVVKDPEFAGAILFAGGTALVPILYLLQSILFTALFGWEVGVLYFMLLPITRWLFIRLT